MNIQRGALLGGIFLIVFLLLLEWNQFRQTITPAPNVSITTTSQQPDASLVSEQNNPGELPVPARIPDDTKQRAASSGSLIDVKTDVLHAKIDPVGGDIVMVSLPTYWATLETPDVPFDLLNRNEQKTYIAQSGLIGINGTDLPGSRPAFDVAKTQYVLTEGENELFVDLMLPAKNGVSITKRFVFSRNDYLVRVVYLIENQGNATWSASFFGQIKRDGSVPETTATGLAPFLGAATTTNEERYKKLALKDIAEEPFKETIHGGWIAFVQHYFISAWIGNKDDANSYFVRKLKNEDLYLLGYTAPARVVEPGQSAAIEGRFYAGPKTTKKLEEISPFLDLTVDYGWLWWVAKPIHWILQEIYLLLQNWGWSIVTLTLVIKIILFPLSHKAYISMGHMRKVAPKINAIREECGDNRQKLQEEMLKLYRTEKINPMGGCLPMLLQMPVFIALYWVLMESVELRHAPFLGWINDLSVMDPYFVLPILMGVSMYFQQQMNPAPPDPMQAKIMQFLPIIFTIMFLWFPAGLVLYWLINNLSSMAHQYYINKLVERGKA